LEYKINSFIHKSFSTQHKKAGILALNSNLEAIEPESSHIIETKGGYLLT
jgi:hypothetical protein